MPNQELFAIQAVKVPRHAELVIYAFMMSTLKNLVIMIAVRDFLLIRQLPFSEAVDKFKLLRIHV